MSMASAATGRRWLAVGAGVLLLCSAPPALAAVRERVPAQTQPVAARALLARVLHSGAVPYQGTAESRGSLALPDLPHVRDLAALLGGTTRTRVFWRSPTHWRVDTLTDLGEDDTYGAGADVVTWSFERGLERTILGTAVVRLPRADDLLPPQLARRALRLHGTGDRLETIPARRVAGRVGLGLRLRTSGKVGTVSRVDVWVDQATGIPLQVLVADRAGRTAVSSRFTSLTSKSPAARVLRPPEAVGAQHDVTFFPDLAAGGNRFGTLSLPSRLAGLPTSSTRLGGAATYGEGLSQFAVLPLPGFVVRGATHDAEAAGSVEEVVAGGRLVVLTASVLTVVLARSDARGGSFVLAGLVTPDTLRTAAQALFADSSPP